MKLPGDMLLVVHVPKTAGTSLRQALERFFNTSKVIRDYGPRAPETTRIVQEHLYCKERKGTELLVKQATTQGAKVLIGHFAAQDYSRFFLPENIIAFVREPLDRACSEYLHHLRQSKTKGPFSQFIEGQNVINIQSRLLSGLSQASFIGVTENYSESLRYLNKRHGLKLKRLKKNRDPRGGGVEFRQNLLQADINRFYELNKLDVALYEDSVRDFSKLEIPRTKAAQLLDFIRKSKEQ